VSVDPRAEHLRAWEALPWVANGRATPEQARVVTEHLAHCEDCRAELAWQQRLHAALAEGATPLQAGSDTTGDPDTDTEAGLQRLLARLDDAPEQVQPAPAGRVSRLTWALAAAVVLQAAGLGVMSLHVGSGPDADGEFRTLSDPTPTAPAATLRVLPDAAMRLADWQALLEVQGLQVVAGPNSAGAYALGPAPGAAVLPPAQVLARLRGTPGIRLAEPIVGTP